MNHDFFYREWNWIEQLSAAFHVFAANIKSILKVLLIVFLPIRILESIINGRMLNAYTVFQQIAYPMKQTFFRRPIRCCSTPV